MFYFSGYNQHYSRYIQALKDLVKLFKKITGKVKRPDIKFDSMGKTTLGKHFKDGDLIIKQGTLGDCIYVIQEGKVEIIEEKDNREIKIAELGAKEFFGEMALFEEDVRSCSVRAVGDAKLITLDKENFYNAIKKDPELAIRLLEKMSGRLRETNKKIGYV